MAELVNRKMGTPNATFKDLSAAGKADLYVYATNLSTHFSQVFSIEHSPEMAIADAVRMSMSLPVFFAAVRDARKDVFVDGGVLINYPVKLFDRVKYLDPDNASRSGDPTRYQAQNREFLNSNPGRSPYTYNKETLGFRLDTQKEIATFRHDEPRVEEINQFFDYAVSLG